MTISSIKLGGWFVSIGLVLIANSIPHAVGEWNVSGLLSYVAGGIGAYCTFHR